MVTAVDIILVAAMLAAAAFVQGYCGFGFGIVGTTLLAFLPHNMTAMTVVVTVCATVGTLLLLRLSHADVKVKWRYGLLVTSGAVLGMPLGYGFIHVFGDRPVFRAALGVTLLAFAANGLLFRPRRRKVPAPVGVLAGMLGGFLGGAFVTGGPPVVMYLYSQADDPRDMKATIQFVFVMGLIYRHVAISIAGDYNADVLILAAVAAPVCAVVLWLGHRLSRGISVESFRRAVFVLVAVFGVALIVRAAATWMG